MCVGSGRVNWGASSSRHSTPGSVNTRTMPRKACTLAVSDCLITIAVVITAESAQEVKEVTFEPLIIYGHYGPPSYLLIIAVVYVFNVVHVLMYNYWELVLQEKFLCKRYKVL